MGSMERLSALGHKLGLCAAWRGVDWEIVFLKSRGGADGERALAVHEGAY
jgi:hypothetical protein